MLCLDVGPSMSLSPLDGGETALEKSIRVARQITQQKVPVHCVPVDHSVCGRCLQEARICWDWFYLELPVKGERGCM